VPELTITVEGAKVIPFAASPQMAFALRVRNVPASQRIHTAVLRCQMQLEVTRRSYTSDEETLLRDLFGEPSRWGQTLRSMLWTHTSVVVPSFTDETTVELPVACTFDFNVAATKYFYALADGDVPLSFLFSGSVFYENAGAPLQVAPISWNVEARYRLPVSVWQELMAHYSPNTAALHLRRDVFDQLYRYKVERGIPTFEAVVERLLADKGREERGATDDARWMKGTSGRGEAATIHPAPHVTVPEREDAGEHEQADGAP